VIAQFRPRVTGAFRIRLDAPGPLVRPPLKLRLEHAGLEAADLALLEQQLLARLGERLRIRPELEWLAPETIPREAGKTRHIEIVPA
jgi:phenylacetate-CoA ligase